MGSPPIGFLQPPPWLPVRSAANSVLIGGKGVRGNPSSVHRATDSYCCRGRFGSGRRRKSDVALSSTPTVLVQCSYEFIRRSGDVIPLGTQNLDKTCMLGSDEDIGLKVPTQVQSIVEGSGTIVAPEYKPIPDIDYLQELLAIQQQGPRAIGFFGTRNMGFMHQQLIEVLSYAMVITKNHIYTSGAAGTNAAVIRGALRAEKPELLTVILPQSLKKQPPESQELLAKVKNLIEKPCNDHLSLVEASRLCNKDILSHVQQVICFAFHDSKLLMETCQEAKNLRKIVTLFYLD
ncbi:hypothetical protein HPP92_024700 [Vanilla planifolia]|uniref:Uncharacterized protein n=1 Tax=Vanilla planifolia TaxID=51239 RepID=A0A835UBR5_VANPL|nr:hypothetical protein HPP92_024700 [Vanilla planifolia]